MYSSNTFVSDVMLNAADDARSARNDVGVTVTDNEYAHSKKTCRNNVMLAENTGRRCLGVYGDAYQWKTKEP
jgi:hypothetical protein